MAERGIGLAHTTILRWVQRYTPGIRKALEPIRPTVGGSWRMDETYIKVNGRMGVPVPGCGKAGKNGRFLL